MQLVRWGKKCLMCCCCCRFERELEALRKEVAENSMKSALSGESTPGVLSRDPSSTNLQLELKDDDSTDTLEVEVRPVSSSSEGSLPERDSAESLESKKNS